MTSRISFRDPCGQLLVQEDRVVRSVNEHGRADIEAFLGSVIARDGVAAGRIVETAPLAQREGAAGLPASFAADSHLLLEHRKIFFPSYPCEWPAEMLHAAASLTLDLAEQFLEEGLGLKDATPYNVLFEGTRPVFIDVLSVERRDAEDAIWLPQAQFERTFLLPLLMNRYFDMTLDQIFLSSREGIVPERVYSLCRGLRRFLPPFFSAVTLPVWLGARQAAREETLYRPRRASDPEKARFILRYTLKRLRKLLEKGTPDSFRRTSTWSDYATSNSYSEAGAALKASFVEAVVREHRPKAVLDVGANTGNFSRIAAAAGARVVAIDIDPVVVGRLWCAARREGLDIQPLVVNLAHPTPATGWRNDETASFLQRAAGSFDAVFMLAVVHHLLVTERVPLAEIFALAAQCTRKLLVVEFVGQEDPMFRTLCRGRMELFRWYTREIFEEGAAAHFRILSRERVPETQRWLYLMEKRAQ